MVYTSMKKQSLNNQ